MGASAQMKMLARGDIEASRGIEAVAFEAEKFVLVTDDNDALYCPGVTDEPSEGLVQSMRNGWLSGSIVICVNRGPKGGVPVPVVVAGRSRIKAAVKVNLERAARKLAPIKPEAVFVSAEEAADLMYLENNKQERAPTFDARRWCHFKKIFVRDGLAELAERTGKKGASDEEVAGLESEARASYSAKTNCKPSAFKRWELIMSAHPEVLRMCDVREPGINLSAVKDIVISTSYEAQPEAARRVVELAKRKDKMEEKPEAPMQDNGITHSDLGQASPDHETVNAPEKQSRGTRSERSDRREALGIGSPRPITAKKLGELLSMLNTIDVPDMVDPRPLLALVLGQTEFDGLPIADHPSMGEVVKMAKRVKIKVTK
jgi:hypothetical protein